MRKFRADNKMTSLPVRVIAVILITAVMCYGSASFAGADSHQKSIELIAKSVDQSKIHYCSTHYCPIKIAFTSPTFSDTFTLCSDRIEVKNVLGFLSVYKRNVFYVLKSINAP